MLLSHVHMTEDAIKNIDVNSLFKSFYISVIKQSVFNFVAVARIKAIGKLDIPSPLQKNKKRHHLPRLVMLLSILSIITVLYLILYYHLFQKRHSVGQGTTRNSKTNKMKRKQK